MNTENCSAGYATDQIFRLDNPVGTCDMPIALYIFFGICLASSKGILACLHWRTWLRRQRKRYAKADKRKQHPINPTLNALGFVAYAVFYALAFANVINAANGWTYAIYSVGWFAFGVTSIFFFIKLVRLGRKLVPIIQEKRRNEMMLEQMQRDDDDPPTYSSGVGIKKQFGMLAPNPLYEDDPPTYDENSSSQNANSPIDSEDKPHIFPHHRNLFNQRVRSGRLLFEKRVAGGKMLLGRQVQNGRNIFSKRAASEVSRGAVKKVAMDPPPKNPMWEEDPPTTYSILDIVEPQLDKLKRLDVFGQLFFVNEIAAVTAQLIIFFFIITVSHPGEYYIAVIGFGCQAFFLLQYLVSMNWQFARAISAVRESRRKSRRNENIEAGLLKMRRQQLTVFLFSGTAAIIYILLAAQVMKPYWYWTICLMCIDTFASAVIYRTMSFRSRGKINEMKRNFARAQKQNNAGAQGEGAAQGTPKKNGNGALANTPGDANDAAESKVDEAGQPRVVKSSVAHVRESAKFATMDSTKRGDEKEDIKSAAISW